MLAVKQLKAYLERAVLGQIKWNGCDMIKPVTSPSTSIHLPAMRIPKDCTGMVIGKKVEIYTTQIFIPGKEDNCTHAINKTSESIFK